MTPLHDPIATEERGHRLFEHAQDERMVMPLREVDRIETELEKNAALKGKTNRRPLRNTRGADVHALERKPVRRLPAPDVSTTAVKGPV